MRAILAELIGTYFLVLVVGLVAGGIAPAEWAPIAIASVLCVCVCAFGHASGAHFNPAVSVAVWLRKRIGVARLVAYIVAQLAGAYLAVLTCSLLDAWSAPGPLALAGSSQIVLAESLFTFLLVTVILNVAATKGTEGNQYFPFAIAGTVLAGAICVGSVSGAVFNPAVGTGLVAMGALPSAKLILFIASQLVGAIVAAWVHGVMETTEVGR
ncbi:MAG: aquaporin [Planctomycetota bacterium]|nr:aquaporin [Planctomycetota bacterium]MDA1105225.1 aquaporin [Planctomycetota bacterium]